MIAANTSSPRGRPSSWPLRCAMMSCVELLPTSRLPHVTAQSRDNAIPAVSATDALREAAESSSLDAVKQLAMDALRRSSEHESIVRDMLAAGHIVRALRYVRRNRVESLPPALFVEAANASGNAVVIASTLNFCSAHAA